MTKQEMTEKLAGMGLNLPEVAKAVGSYVPAVRSGSLVFVSGQLPLREGKVRYTGMLGDNVTVEGGQQAARLCALNALAALVDAAGGIENITRIVRLAVFVRPHPRFRGPAQGGQRGLGPYAGPLRRERAPRPRGGRCGGPAPRCRRRG